MFDFTNGQFSSNDLTFVESEEYSDPRKINKFDVNNIISNENSSFKDEQFDLDDAIWAVELDNSGRIDLLPSKYEAFDTVGFQHIFGDFDGDFTGCAIICFKGERWTFGHDDYPTPEELHAMRLEKDDAIDSCLPSSSSNHEGPRKLTWDESETKWNRRWYKSERRGSGKQRAPKWQRLAGSKRGSKRDSFRQWQKEAFDAYYLENQGYTTEEYLDDPVALLSDEDRAFYEADYIRFVESYVREIDSQFDPVTQSNIVVDTWERHLFPERFDDFRTYSYHGDYDYYDGYGDNYFFGDDRMYYGQFEDDPDYPKSDDWREQEEWNHFSQLDSADDLENQRVDDIVADNDNVDMFNPSFVGRRSPSRAGNRQSRRYSLQDWNREAVLCG